MVSTASVLAILGVLQKRYARWLARWRARSAANFKLRLALLLAFGVCITVLGAALYRWSNPEEDWNSALFTVYAVLYSIPGADITNNPSLLATFVLNLIFIFGLLVFATILAMITDEINNVMLAARSGKSPVALSGHILLLNWNQQVPFILDQLEQIQLSGGSHPFANRPLVILDDKDKEGLDAQVLGLLKHGQLEVHTRSGKPYRLEHLSRAAAADAFAVLLMHPESSGGGDDGSETGDGGGGDEGGGGSDDASVSVVGAAAAQGDSEGAAALKLQTIMALTALQAGKKVAMVVQAPDDTNIGLQELDQVLLRAGHPANLMNLPVRKMVNSLAVQTTLQPWSASIYHSILQQGLQPSLTFTKVPKTLFLLKSTEPSDRTVSFEEARTAVAADMLTVGFVSGADGQLFLNPPEGSRVSPGDTLVALTTQDKVATSGAKLPLSASIQASVLKAALAVQNSPSVNKLRSLVTPKAAAAATLPAAAAGAASSSSSGTSSSTSGSSAQALASRDAPKGGPSSLAAVEESPVKPEAAAFDPASDSDALPTTAVAGQAGPQSIPVKAVAEIDATDRATPAAAAAAAAAAATARGVAGPQTPDPSAHLSSSAAGGTTQIADSPDNNSTRSGAGTAPAAAAVAATAAAVAAGRPATPGSDMAAAADTPSAAAPAAPATAAAAAAAADTSVAARGIDQSTAGSAGTAGERSAKQPMQPRTRAKKQQKKKSTSLFACCFAPSAVDDEGDEDGPEEAEGAASAAAAGSAVGGKKAPAFGATGGKPGSFKMTDIGKTVTGAVTSVGKGVTTVGKGVTSAVTTVADGAVGMTKTVVTGAVNTVADGAALVGKTVTTVADGAVGLSKTVATGAVGAVTGGAGLVTKTVTSAVKGPMLLKSDASASKPPGAAGGGLLGTSTGWLFGGSNQKLAAAAKSAAAGRLAHVDMAAARAPPAQPLRIVVAGFTAEEAAAELLPHFLDFAPANSTVTFVVKEASPPEGFEAQGTIEEDEEREGAEPLHHCIHYRFLPSANPTSGAALSEAGLLQADSVLLAADEVLRSSPAEADAAVLSCLVSIQHMLATKGAAAVALSHSRSLAGRSSATTNSSTAGASAGSVISSAVGSVTKGVGSVTKGVGSVTKGAANLTFKAAATAVSAAKTLSMLPVRDAGSTSDGQRGQQGLAARAKPKVPHVVACVSTTSSKSVAAAFFGPPGATSSSSGVAAAAAGGAAGAGGGLDGVVGGRGVVGSRLFTYELLVPGEIEGSVLVNVANQPLYVKVVHEMLVTSEGCELYLLTPTAFGFSEGEELAFAEVQEVGRLLRRTTIGVVSDGLIHLAPDTTWRWRVKANDRIAAIADSW